MDEQARKALQDDGCPPCYPTGLCPPLLNIPDQYKPIISFWNSLLSTGLVVLRAQLSDWEEFRSFQKRIRQYYARNLKPFTEFKDKVRERRQRHKLEGHVCQHLQLDVGQQNALGNWIEFQNYHLQICEGYEEIIEDDREKLAAAQKRLKDRGISWLEGLEEVEFYEKSLYAAECKPRQHKLLLRWIEQQRKVIASEQATSIHDTKGHEDGRRTMRTHSALGHRKSERKAGSVLSPVQTGVSKKTGKRSLQTQKRNVPQAAKYEKADGRVASRSNERISDHRTHKQKRGGESMSLHPLRPQRVSKTTSKPPKGKQAGKFNAKASHMRQPQGGRQQDSVDGAQIKRRNVTTSSGRESKRPERFCPG